MSEPRMVEEQEATGKVKEIYAEIKQTLGIDFVPNMYKAQAVRPDLLEAGWNKTKAVMHTGKLDKLTKEIIAVAVSAVAGCRY
jgi:alkylhydroperoxidase/carboxymuconolactone decarboxylase family protein YurZ